MRCERCRKLLSWYLESDLPPEEMKRIEEHLSVCKVCSQELKLLKETLTLARGLPQLEPLEQACLELMEKVKKRFERIIYIWGPIGGETKVHLIERPLQVSREAGKKLQYRAWTARRLDGTWWKFVKISFPINLSEKPRYSQHAGVFFE